MTCDLLLFTLQFLFLSVVCCFCCCSFHNFLFFTCVLFRLCTKSFSEMYSAYCAIDCNNRIRTEWNEQWWKLNQMYFPSFGSGWAFSALQYVSSEFCWLYQGNKCMWYVHGARFSFPFSCLGVWFYQVNIFIWPKNIATISWWGETWCANTMTAAACFSEMRRNI